MTDEFEIASAGVIKDGEVVSLFAIDDRLVEVEPEMVPKASRYGCGADKCQDCYPVIYRCEHGVDYPKPRINNTAARDAQLEECEHHDESLLDYVDPSLLT